MTRMLVGRPIVRLCRHCDAVNVKLTCGRYYNAALTDRPGEYSLPLDIDKKSPANAKGNARQRCMCEGTLRTKLSSSIPATDIGYDVFTYTRWRHRLAWMLPLLKCVSQPKIAEKSIKNPLFLRSRSSKDIENFNLKSVAIESQCTASY